MPELTATDYATRRGDGDIVTVPKGRYTDEGFAELERRHLWSRVWQFACLREDVADPGDFFEYRIGTDSYLIVHGRDGVLRAFHNTCSHRGFRLAEGRGNVDEIRCGFHHWCYDLKGRLRGVPFAREFGSLDRDANGLKPVRLDTWGRLVFLNPAPEGPDLATFLGELPQELAVFGLEDRTCEFSVTIPVDGNWKTTCDAFLEVYHLQGIHPQLDGMMDDLHTRYRCFAGGHSMMLLPLGLPSPRLGPDVSPREVLASYFASYGSMLDHEGDDAAQVELRDGEDARSYAVRRVREVATQRGLDFDRYSDSQLVDDYHYLAFPNVIFNIHSEIYTIFRARPGPDPNTCDFDFMVLKQLPKGDPRTFQRPEHVHVPNGTRLNEVVDQDVDGIALAQAGLRSSGFGAMQFGHFEQRLSHMHQTLDRWLGLRS